MRTQSGHGGFDYEFMQAIGFDAPGGPDVLRPETLSEFYGVSVSVHHEDDGTVVVVPRRTPG